MTVGSVGSVLAKRGERNTPFIDEIDVRHFIERWYVERGLRHVRCKQASTKQVVVIAVSPVERMMMYLLEYDLRGLLSKEFDMSFKKMVITQW